MEAQRCCDASSPSVWATENRAKVGINVLKLRPYNPSPPDSVAKKSIVQAVSGLHI
jgi:hypothetical protein